MGGGREVTLSDAASYLPMMRFVWIGALSLLLAGAAAAASSQHAPLRLGGMLESRGAVDLGSAPGKGELLRFIPFGQFELGLLLRNTSRGTLVVTNARLLEPRRTLVHQIGTRFHPWHVFKCPPGAMCPAHGFPLKGGPARPRPFSVAVGKYLGVELDLRLGSCAEIPGANPAPITRLRVSFRTATGVTGRRVFALDGAELHLRMPKPEDCAQPRSTLSIEGPQRYATSYYWTEPGSTGDVCTIAGRTLSFESRVYQAGIVQRPVRVTVRIRHFAGAGSYRATVSAVVRGRQVVSYPRSIVTVTAATRRKVIAQVATTRRAAPDGRGTPFKIAGTMRCRVVR